MTNVTRHPKLARLAATDNEVLDIKFKAIDKLTAAHMAVSLLNRHGVEPAKEMAQEEKTIELMEDATYLFRKYLRAKFRKYEELLQNDAIEKDKTIERGNSLIRATRELAKERGIQ